MDNYEANYCLILQAALNYADEDGRAWHVLWKDKTYMVVCDGKHIHTGTPVMTKLPTHLKLIRSKA